MVDLIIFLLIVYGVCHVVVESEIFRYIRERITNKYLNYLINCMTCFSFWVGSITSIFIPITGLPLVDGLISMGAMNIIQKIISF